MDTSYEETHMNIDGDIEEELSVFNNMSEIRDYYLKCLEIVNKIENMDEVLVKELVVNGEITLPTEPKKSLSNLLKCSKKKNVKSIHQVHNLLIKLISNTKNIYDFTCPEVCDITSIYNLLTNYNVTMKKHKANSFYITSQFGYYLDIYFQNYKNKNIPWKKHIKSCFNISDSHGRKLRYIGILVHQFPKLGHLSITLEKFWKMYSDIKQMLNFEGYALFWSEK